MQLMILKVKMHEAGLDEGHILMQLAMMARKMTILAAGGAVCGMVAGVITTVRSCLALGLANTHSGVA